MQDKNVGCIVPVGISHSLCALVASMVSVESMKVAVHVHFKNRFIRLMLLSEINDHTNQA